MFPVGLVEAGEKETKKVEEVKEELEEGCGMGKNSCTS